ncbi:hypothetical protein FOXYSP1_19005 [Fusarium oxysporum f. sp. phaseoli]
MCNFTNHLFKPYYLLLENPGIPLPFRIQTNSLKVLDLKFKVLDNQVIQKYIFSPSTTAQYKQQVMSPG